MPGFLSNKTKASCSGATGSYVSLEHRVLAGSWDMRLQTDHTPGSRAVNKSKEGLTDTATHGRLSVAGGTPALALFITRTHSNPILGEHSRSKAAGRCSLSRRCLWGKSKTSYNRLTSLCLRISTPGVDLSVPPGRERSLSGPSSVLVCLILS